MFIRDPKDYKPSVSLTLLLVSFIILIIACISEVCGFTKGLSGLPEVFYSVLALYFGRRMNVKGSSFEVSQFMGGDTKETK